MEIAEIQKRLRRDGEAFRRECEELDYEGFLLRVLDRLGLTEPVREGGIEPPSHRV